MRVVRVAPGELADDDFERIADFERRFAAADVGEHPMVCEPLRDYTRFWRAIGRVSAMAATDNAGRVIGMGAAVGMRLRMPGGSIRGATYIDHLRLAPECRYGPALAMLALRMHVAVIVRGWTAFGLVSDEGGFRPERIAKGLGITALREVGRIRLAYFDCAGAREEDAELVREATQAEVRRAYAAHTRGMISSPGGRPEMRSARTPRWVMTPDGRSCACIEDSELVRRWVLPDGSRLTVANLSFFGWSDVRSAGALVRAAMAIAARDGVPRLRIVIDETLLDSLVVAIGTPPSVAHAWSIRAASLWGVPRAPWSLHPTEL
jgi:hypothetical protein